MGLDIIINGALGNQAYNDMIAAADGMRVAANTMMGVVFNLENTAKQMEVFLLCFIMNAQAFVNSIWGGNSVRIRVEFHSFCLWLILPRLV